MSTLETALVIAAQAHSGQRDKAGLPYILHPLRVMSLVESIDEKIVAVLHDVPEDTKITIADLRKEGFDENILDALGLLTHDRDVSYTDYVIRLKNGDVEQHRRGINGTSLAVPVKIADLKDNSQLSRSIIRVRNVDRDIDRLRRYFLSYQYLDDRLSEQDYRILMGGM